MLAATFAVCVFFFPALCLTASLPGFIRKVNGVRKLHAATSPDWPEGIFVSKKEETVVIQDIVVVSVENSLPTGREKLDFFRYSFPVKETLDLLNKMDQTEYTVEQFTKLSPLEQLRICLSLDCRNSRTPQSPRPSYIQLSDTRIALGTIHFEICCTFVVPPDRADIPLFLFDEE